MRVHGWEVPDELPERPDGWTKRMQQHLNFGRDGGTGIYSIYTPEAVETCIGYQYDTRKGGLTGFTLPGIDGVMRTWFELRAVWPQFIKEHTP